MKNSRLELAIKQIFPDYQGEWPELRVCCPFPDCDDDRYRFGINVSKKVAHCFNCGVRLNSFQLEELFHSKGSIYEPTSFESIESEFEEIENQSRPSVIGKIQSLEDPGIRILECKRSKYWPELRKGYHDALDYLSRRGFDPLQISADYRLQISLLNELLNDRIILPVYAGPDLVYWQARSLSNGEPRYLNPHKSICPLGKSQFVFNVDVAKNYGEVLICEGIFSALACGLSAVAIFGKDLSDMQAFKLVRARIRKVCIVLDPGAEGSAIKIAKKLKDRMDVRIATLQGGDPNELDKQELAEWIKIARPFEDIEFDL